MTRYLLFDGDCGICQAFAGFAKALDVKQRFDIRPYQAFPTAEKSRYPVPDTDFARWIFFIDTESGKISRGAFAMNTFFWAFYPWKLLVAVLYIIPIFLLAEMLVYRLVADNRMRLSRWFGLQACRIDL